MFGRHRSPKDVALAFVAACNARDIAGVKALLDPAMVFSDSRGERLEGAAAVLEAVARVNAVAPDLRVEIDQAVQRGELVLLSGRSLSANPALTVATQWSARVRKGLLVEWQAFGRPADGSLVGLLRALGHNGEGK
ncbi:nuclear transport factor 2 family protein [Alteraurantiacibacter buctensis]|uniref:SnoaL-like domain-containing protein n=1 Tax=Alteraurantiacibacter buctensis TaxID=1503981 RepID=A0A844YWU5_9SPHN|nr:nuclear transport factor 2 family protein [Alteraurantiacibacter buctensis]MXO72039.1 hypothetical protein [Alteraurantiacibacter buctensis]